MAEVTCVLQYRTYEKSVRCMICYYPCRTCVFYCCGCKRCKFNLCPGCCREEMYPYIQTCKICSVKEKVIDFSSFCKKSILLAE